MSKATIVILYRPDGVSLEFNDAEDVLIDHEGRTLYFSVTRDGQKFKHHTVLPYLITLPNE